MLARYAGIAIVLATVACAAGAIDQPPASALNGVWVSPRGNVKVQTRPCGQALCGTVVWASADARLKAKAAGTDPLVGVELFTGYHKTSRGHWEGRVFVPDLSRHFFSRLQPITSDKVKISGCLLGGMLCKSQVWTRES